MVKLYERKIAFRIAILPLSFILLCWLFMQGYTLYCLFFSPVIVYQLYAIFRYQRNVYAELEQFTQAIKYHDFSRHFNVNRAPSELQPLHHAFNILSDSFKLASVEKETQHQYLQQILEIVDTGIISFNQLTGDVVWMNDYSKRMLNLPPLKNINALEKRNANLLNEINTLAIGNNKLITLPAVKSQSKVLISATAFQIKDQQFKLITFQNISAALEETEADAWSRLLRVMTHEIMNSIAPIASLAGTLNTLLEESVKSNEPQPSYREDMQVGIDTIRKRSESLLKFADTYRNLTKITTLNLKEVLVKDLFQNQHYLMAPTLIQRGIALEIVLKDTDLHVEADSSLLEQVLINLIINAIEAVKDAENPKIILAAEMDIHRKCIIRVNDNGPGIPQHLLDKIFVPFFSTKKTGSGIGLNVCKQIMMLHKGSIVVQTVENAGTSFILTL